MPSLPRPTTDFAYVRWLGNRAEFAKMRRAGGLIDREAELDRWSRAIAALVASGTALWGFANDIYQGSAPATIASLLRRLASQGASWGSGFEERL